MTDQKNNLSPLTLHIFGESSLNDDGQVEHHLNKKEAIYILKQLESPLAEKSPEEIFRVLNEAVKATFMYAIMGFGDEAKYKLAMAPLALDDNNTELFNMLVANAAKAREDEAKEKTAKAAQDNPDDPFSQIHDRSGWCGFVQNSFTLHELEIPPHRDFFIRHRLEPSDKHSTPEKLEGLETELNKAHLVILHKLAKMPDLKKEKFLMLKNGKPAEVSLAEFDKRDATDENMVIITTKDYRTDIGLESCPDRDNKIEFYFLPSSRKLASAVTKEFSARKVLMQDLLPPELSK